MFCSLKLGICCYCITYMRCWYISSLSSSICVHYEQAFSTLLSAPTAVSLVHLSVSIFLSSSDTLFSRSSHIWFQLSILGLPIDHLFDMMSNTVLCTHYISMLLYHWFNHPYCRVLTIRFCFLLLHFTAFFMIAKQNRDILFVCYRVKSPLSQKWLIKFKKHKYH